MDSLWDNILLSPNLSGSSEATILIKENQMTQNQTNGTCQEVERIYKNLCGLYL